MVSCLCTKNEDLKNSMSARLKRNMPLLRALCQAPPSKRKDILENCSTDFLQSFCELSLNLLKGNIPLSGIQYKKLKKQKNFFKLLANKKTNLKTKFKALRKQSGGFLLPLLGAVIPILGQLLGGLARS